MRLAPSRNFARGFALTLTVALSAAACTAGEVTTTAGPAGPAVTGTAPPPGTVILADLNGEGAAEGLGKVISVTPETTTTTTTTTAAPIIAPTTPRPVITTSPTTPPPTQSVPTPTQTLPQPLPGGGKPPQAPVSISALSGDEQDILNNINGWRAGQGLGALVPEQAAIDAARTHTAQMLATTPPQQSAVSDVLNAVNARYTQLISLGTYRPTSEGANGLAVYVTTNYGQVVGLPFAYVGIGVTVSTSSKGSLRWITVIVGS